MDTITTARASVNMQRVIRSNWAVRREFEGPAMAELTRAGGPEGGWAAIEERRLNPEWKGSKHVLCGTCFEQRSANGTCACTL